MLVLRLLIQLVLLSSLVSPLCADTTIPLSVYLQNANESGLRIIFSSGTVPSHLQVTINNDNVVTIEQVGRVLASYRLFLAEVSEDVYVVKRMTDQLPEPGDDLITPASLEPLPTIEEIIVTSSLYKLMMRNTFNVQLLGHEELARRPAIANDALRTINHLPGSATIGISARPRVRGGNEDETLVQFNGVRLYEPFHLKEFSGLFSTVDSRIVNSLEFMSGGFPVQYGDRLSAVLQINTETPESLGDIRELGVGIYTASYLQSGGSDDQHYLIDIRRSTLEGLASVSETDFGTPVFGDIYARYDWDLSEGQHLSINLLWYADDVALNNSNETEEAESHYRNTYFWVDYETDSIFGLKSRTIFSLADIKNDREGEVDIPDQVEGELEETQRFNIYALSQTFSHELDGESYLQAGLELRYLDASYELASELEIAPAFQGLSNYIRPSEVNFNETKSGGHVALFTNYRWHVLANLYADLGIRIDWQTYLASNTSQVSPRINFLYRMQTGTELRIGWGRFAQAEGIHELKISDGLAEFQAPQKSNHTVAGITHIFDSGFRVRVEAYYKKGIDNNLYYENLANSLTLVPELQVDRYLVEPEDFIAKGIEVTLDGYLGDVDWWLNYSFSSARDKVGNTRTSRSWDQENSANGGVSMQWGKWQHTLTATYHSGWPTTPLTLGSGGNVVASTRNSVRFEVYTSLDYKTMRTWKFGKGRSLRLEAGVTNLLNRENQIGTEYVLDDGELVNTTNFALPLAPFADIYWRF